MLTTEKLALFVNSLAQTHARCGCNAAQLKLLTCMCGLGAMKDFEMCATLHELAVQTSREQAMAVSIQSLGMLFQPNDKKLFALAILAPNTLYVTLEHRFVMLIVREKVHIGQTYRSPDLDLFVPPHVRVMSQNSFFADIKTVLFYTSVWNEVADAAHERLFGVRRADMIGKGVNLLLLVRQYAILDACR